MKQNGEILADFTSRNGLPQSFSETASQFYLPLLESLISIKRTRAVEGKKAPLILGINGAQGSGKSTFADFIAYGCSEKEGWRVSCLSLDDIYHKKSKRQELSETIHPMLATRGVPGTHDLNLGNRTLKALIDLQEGESVAIPRFDKATDDQVPESEWSRAEGVQDLIIFEGWCMGCTPQASAELEKPLNELERQSDSDCLWRSFVNHSIQEYQEQLWSFLDLLIMLKVPSFEQVYIWRTEQEQKLTQSLGRETELSDPVKMKYFISHYERLTRHMLANLPKQANLVLSLNEDHKVFDANPSISDFEQTQQKS